MFKKTFTKKLRLTLLGLALALPLAGTSVWGWTRSLPPRHENVEVRGRRYHYHEGRFYRRAWFGFGFDVVAPPIGAVVTVVPDSCQTVVYGGTPYYYYDDVYYAECPSGYVVVQTPVNRDAVSVPAQSEPAPQTQTVSGKLSEETNASNNVSGAVTVAVSTNAVSAPSVTQPQQPAVGKEIINIPDSKGGYTPITLTKHNDGYTGPQGEYYPGNPTVEQLKVLYGK